MKKLVPLFGVLLFHTAAAEAQQQQVDPNVSATPGMPPAAPPQQVAPLAPQPMPPAYAPPPGYNAAPQPAAPAPAQTYGAAPSYAPPPAYAAPSYPPPPPPYPPSYRYAPYRYAPPTYYSYPPPPPPRDVLYRPFTLGGGIGFGGVGFTDQNTGNQTHANGLAYTFRLGFGLRPGLLLLWDVEGAAATHNGSSMSQTANLVALQLFISRRWFLKGGFGLAEAIQDDFPSLWGGAAMGGVGYELVQGWNWSLDVEATITGARFNSSGTDQNWTNWSLVNFALNFF